MTRLRVRAIVPVLACLLAGASLPAAAALPSATPEGRVAGPAAVSGEVMRACVNKRTGRIRWLTKRKCRKGERRITWNRTGQVGPAGPAGGTLQVLDGTGAVVPNVVHVSTSGLQVLVGDGIYDYRWDGQLDAREPYAIYFIGAGCAGAALVPFAAPGFAPGGPYRILVYGPDLVTVHAYAISGTTTLAAGAVVSTYFGSPPACVALPPIPTETEVTTLAPTGVALPPALAAPLRLSLT